MTETMTETLPVIGDVRTERPGGSGPERVGTSLEALWRGVARRCPVADGTLDVFPAPTGPSDVAVAFAGYSVVAADVAPDWVGARVPVGGGTEPGRHGAVAVGFLEALAAHLGVPAPGVHLLLAAPKPPDAGRRTALRPSDRVEPTWASHRSDVTGYVDDEGGLVNFGRGPGGRLDLLVTLDGADRTWLRPTTFVQSRDLLHAARALAGEDLFASVPVWDTFSVRTYLTGGFRPVGGEALLLTRPRGVG
jgi:hypothetical protein